MKIFYFFLFIFITINIVNAVIHRRKGVDNDFIIDPAGTWQGKWFPHKPNSNKDSTAKPHVQFKPDNNIDYKDCDGDIEKVVNDFDPANKQHSYNYLCLSSNRSAYTPNLETEAVLVEHHVPPTYVPPVKCLNETINYEEELPTFGAYRLLPPKYGTYNYLPPQRWLRSLAEGAIVMAYHPCAFPAQVTQLQNIVKNCLYRHIITPTQALTPERPLALLVWGKCLRLSVVDEATVIEFIKKNAKQTASEQLKHVPSAENGIFYKAGLVNEAHLITDLDDSEICSFKDM